MFLIVKLAFLICEVLMNRYIAFLKVFERNSFSDAARDLGYTQSAVSQMIKSLEEELGVTLLVRSRSGVALTYEGRHLYQFQSTHPRRM